MSIEHTCFDLRHHYFEYDVQHLEALAMNAEFDRDEAQRSRDDWDRLWQRAANGVLQLQGELETAQRQCRDEKQAHQFTRGELAELTRERNEFKIKANDKDTECIDLMRDLEDARRNLRQVKNDKTDNDEYRLEIEERLRRNLAAMEKERDEAVKEQELIAEDRSHYYELLRKNDISAHCGEKCTYLGLCSHAWD